MSDAIGPMPSNIGEITSSPRLPYVRPKTADEQMKESLARKSAWEEEQERRKATHARLAKELREAEEKALRAASELPVAEERKKTLLSAKERTSEKWLKDPVAYGREIGYADRHIKDLEADLRAPERIRERLQRLDAELVGDELALVTAWNQAGESGRQLLLKMIGLSFVETGELHGTQIDITRPLPTTKG
jgi:hypothetical protein